MLATDGFNSFGYWKYYDQGSPNNGMMGFHESSCNNYAEFDKSTLSAPLTKRSCFTTTSRPFTTFKPTTR